MDFENAATSDTNFVFPETRDTCYGKICDQLLRRAIYYPSRCISGKYQHTPRYCVLSDFLAQAIYALTKDHPILADSLVDLLDPLLAFLTTESLELRLHASLALCGFAIAKLKSEDGSSYPRTATTATACEYIDRETKRSKTLDPNKRLPNILKSALAGEEFWGDYGPSFSLTVVASFIILIDRFIWKTPRALKLLVNAIALFAGHRKSNIRKAHPEFWRMLIWAFSRLPAGTQPPNSQESGDTDALRSVRESAYSFLLQERKHGLLTSVVGSLLRPCNGEVRSHADVKKAVGNVLDLIISDDVSSRDDGMQLLGRMLGDMGRLPHRHGDGDGEGDQQPTISFSWSLIDGSAANTIAKDIRVLPFKLDFQQIPPLTEEEIVAHWDELFGLWTAAARGYLQRESEHEVAVRVPVLYGAVGEVLTSLCRRRSSRRGRHCCLHAVRSSPTSTTLRPPQWSPPPSQASSRNSRPPHRRAPLPTHTRAASRSCASYGACCGMSSRAKASLAQRRCSLRRCWSRHSTPQTQVSMNPGRRYAGNWSHQVHRGCCTSSRRGQQRVLGGMLRGGGGASLLAVGISAGRRWSVETCSGFWQSRLGAFAPVHFTVYFVF